MSDEDVENIINGIKKFIGALILNYKEKR